VIYYLDKDMNIMKSYFSLMVFIKATTSPRLNVGVLLLQKEERVKKINFSSFPSFLKEGCPDQSVGTGWLINLF